MAVRQPHEELLGRDLCGNRGQNSPVSDCEGTRPPERRMWSRERRRRESIATSSTERSRASAICGHLRHLRINRSADNPICGHLRHLRINRSADNPICGHLRNLRITPSAAICEICGHLRPSAKSADNPICGHLRNLRITPSAAIGGSAEVEEQVLAHVTDEVDEDGAGVEPPPPVDSVEGVVIAAADDWLQR